MTPLRKKHVATQADFSPLFEEKRAVAERRVGNDGPPPGNRERRAGKDRRQTRIEEITFHEWTHHLLRFRKYVERKKMREAEQAARPAEAAPRSDGKGTQINHRRQTTSR